MTKVMDRHGLFIFNAMNYYYTKPTVYLCMYGHLYLCNHPVYNRCTLFKIKNRGLAVIQQRFDPESKSTWWSDIDPWLNDDIYLNSNFYSYFMEKSGEPVNGLYPTVSVRQIMRALKMKPLPKEIWETSFDRKEI